MFAHHGGGHRVFADGFYRDHDFDFQARVVLGVAAFGAADVGEVLETVSRAGDHDSESWFSAWSGTASRVQAAAERQAASGEHVGAGWGYLRAAQYWATALDVVDGLKDTSVLVPTFQAHRACWEAFVDCAGGRFVRVSVPYEDTTLPGWLLRPDASGAARPTLVMTNGSDGPLTALWACGAAGALDRGWNAFLYDGPGQQSMLFERGVPFRPDWEAVLTPVVDTLVARPDVDAERLFAYGVSQAGYWLPRALAFEKRFRAAVADPGVVDVSTSWTSRLSKGMLDALHSGDREKFDRDMKLALVLPSLKRTLAFRSRPYRKDDPFDVFTEVLRYNLSDVVERIETPLLVCDSEDEQFWPGQPQRLYDLLPGPKELATFTAAQGANFHCQPLARRLTDERMHAFFARHLPPSG